MNDKQDAVEREALETIMRWKADIIAAERERCKMIGETLLGKVKPPNDNESWWDGYESCVYDYQAAIRAVK